MCLIYAADGTIIQRSRNLAGIRRYVSNHLIKGLHIAVSDASGEANLYIAFDNGATFLTRFMSATVLKGFVRRWRNVYGAPMFMNGNAAGTIGYRNESLIGF